MVMIEGWRSKELSDLATFYSGGTPSKATPEFWGDGTPWITVKDMKSMRFSGTLFSLTAEGASCLRVMPPETIFILVRGMGLFKDLPILLSDRPATFNQDIKALVVSKGVDPEFLAYCLLARKSEILRHVDHAGHGTGRLSTDLLESIPLPLPPFPEQLKIADILRTWDDAIEKAEQLIRAQQAQYDVISRRFFQPCHPSFASRTGVWLNFLMGDLFQERVAQGAESDVLLSITMSGGVIDQVGVGRRDSSNEDKSKYKLILPGDIGYNTMRMWQGVSGLSSLRGIVSPAYTVLIPNHQRISSRYAAHLFKSRRMIHDFERYSQGLTSDTWNLKFPVFAEIKMSLPPILHQERQADLLDAMKDEISVIRRQADALADQKRGLMQKLLTGQWRLKV